MLPIPHEYIGSICEIKTLDNVHLTMGRIIKIDHDALEFSNALDDRMALLQYRLPVKIVVHGDNLKTITLAGTTYLSTDNFLRTEDVKLLEAFERRGAFRVNSGVTGKLFRFMTAEEQLRFDQELEAATPEEAEELMEKAYTEVRVMDVSLTGVRLASPIRLQPGHRHFLEFALVEQVMNYGLRVERIIHMPDESEHYGCTFFDVSERQIDALCRDLFALQRIEKNKRRGKLQ